MTPKRNKRAFVFSILFGGFLGLALVKFGNPPILEKLVERPATLLEWLINSWPASTGFGLLGLLVVVGIFSARWTINAPRWMVLLPLVWLFWQFVAATRTVSPELTHPTLLHFTACCVCFYLGLFALTQTPPVRAFFGCLLTGLLVVIIVGWQQHFGGLDETRRYFFIYIYPQMPHVMPEYLKKISSNRIFSTLFYPNALAGALLLLLPMALTLIWQTGTQMTNAARGFLVGACAVAGLACLVWSGSKGGWLLMLGLGLIALLRLDFERKWKLAVMAAVLAVGLTGFALKFAGYFQKGATSAAARADYWHAAVQTAAAHPVFGTGPGTFSIPYKEIKRPESEMARLAHNDYLEQASDSGAVGFLAYTAFVVGGLWVAFRKIAGQRDWLKLSVWLGLLGWGLQGLMEFGLYIPALAWTAFALFGWLLAGGNEFDTGRKDGYYPAQ